MVEKMEKDAAVMAEQQQELERATAALLDSEKKAACLGCEQQTHGSTANLNLTLTGRQWRIRMRCRVAILS